MNSKLRKSSQPISGLLEKPVAGSYWKNLALAWWACPCPWSSAVQWVMVSCDLLAWTESSSHPSEPKATTQLPGLVVQFTEVSKLGSFLVQCLMEVKVKWFLGQQLQFLPFKVSGFFVPVTTRKCINPSANGCAERWKQTRKLILYRSCYPHPLNTSDKACCKQQ